MLNCLVKHGRVVYIDKLVEGATITDGAAIILVQIFATRGHCQPLTSSFAYVNKQGACGSHIDLIIM